jgi:hypothetical protein
MKKWIAHIIYTLFCFLLRYIFGKAKDSDGFGKRAFAALAKAALMPVISCFIFVSSAASEKTLWRHTVFRCGISALIKL